MQRIKRTPASTDPLVATVFATESEQHGAGVLHIVQDSAVKGLVEEGNVYAALEKEVGIELTPLEFADRAVHTISAKTAREIFRSMGIGVPESIHNVAQLDADLKVLPKLTEAQIDEFLRKVLEVTK